MRKFSILKSVVAAMVATVLFATVAFADNVVVENDVVIGPASTKGFIVTQGGSIDVDLSIQGTGGDGGPSGGGTGNCNAINVPISVSLTGLPTGVTADPATVSFSSCDTTKTIQLTASNTAATGDTVVTATPSGGQGTTHGENFTLRVAAPTNAAPTNVSASFGGAVDCRVAATLTVMFDDADSTSWSAVIDWDYDDPTFDEDETVDPIASGDEIGHTYDTPGTYTAAVKVTDNQGATSAIATGSITVDQAYTVTFLRPFDVSTPGLAVINNAKAGRVVPVKVSIYDDCALSPYESPQAAPHIGVSTATDGTGATTDALEAYADAGSANSNDKYFRWSTDGFWIYNLDTRTILNGGPLVTNQSYRVNAFVGSVKATDDEWGLLQTVK